MEVSEFFIDTDQVSEYSIYVVENYQYIANLYGMDLQEYHEEILGKEEETFYEMCFQEGYYDVRKILLIGYIAKQEGISITQKEYESFCQENGVDDEGIRNDLPLYHQINYNILEEKVKEILKQR